MLLVCYDISHNLILLICLLYSVEANLSVDHSKIRSEVLSQWIVPVFKAFTSPSWSIITWISSLLFWKRVVELIFWPESTIKFIFESIHELTISLALKIVVVKLVIVNIAILPIMMIRVASSTPTVTRWTEAIVVLHINIQNLSVAIF